MVKKTEAISAKDGKPRLFGLVQTNPHSDYLWGKNSFNNAFPAALACYMWAKKTPAVYVNAAKNDKELSFDNTDIDIGRVFNAPAGVSSADLRFEFETRFEPYVNYVQGRTKADGADLVVRHDDGWLRLLQIKLTVIPDESTSKRPREHWAPEIVTRPADSCACALGIHHRTAGSAKKVEAIFRDPCATIQDWNNRAEMEVNRQKLLNCVEQFLFEFHGVQQPYLLQPIWMTEGKSPILCDNAFDIFVWSDFALVLAFLEQAKREGAINRATRAAIRFARAQYELSTYGKINIQPIYKEMDYGRQTDKEVAMSGRVTAKYMTSPRRTTPLLPPEVLPEIILGGGHKNLSPERRFDQTVYFAADRYFRA